MSYSESGGGGEGGGDPLVLLHAFPLNRTMWSPQVEALTSGSGTKYARRVITPDYPGFGRSPRPQAQPDVRYYAEGLLGLLDDLHLDKVVLGGISMGGYVAFEAWRLFPERISALVLADTRPDGDPEEAKESRNEVARKVAEGGVEVLPDIQLRRLLSKNTLREKKDVVEQVRGLMLESSPDGVVAALAAMRERPDSTDLLPEISVPVLVIGGEDDDLCPPEVMAAMAERMPDARHVTLTGAGHLSNLEDPDGFNAALGEFLAGLQGTVRADPVR
jgi:pimeloyl-ACP methyl ester carboxylesterase